KLSRRHPGNLSRKLPIAEYAEYAEYAEKCLWFVVVAVGGPDGTRTTATRCSAVSAASASFRGLRVGSQLQTGWPEVGVSPSLPSEQGRARDDNHHVPSR